MKFLKFCFFISLIGIFSSCEPAIEDHTLLGDLPNPSFDIIQGSTPNEFRLVNTTPDVFLTQWEIQDQGSLEGEDVTTTISFMGTYDVTMTTFNQGGHASVTKQVVVTQDDPNACFGYFELLTGCSEKVWKLAAEEGALFVGPDLDNLWWQNNAGDVDTRACHFNDEYIFRADGEYEYDNKGDFWADSDANGNIFPADLGLTVGCQTSDAWQTTPGNYAEWDSGVYTFTANDAANQLTINGLGAWMGLYKVGSDAEVSTPQSSITYNVLELTENRMVLWVNFGPGVWRFTFTSN